MFHVVRRRTGPGYQRDLALEEQSGWDEHARFMDALVNDGFIVLGGPLEDEERVVLVIEAASRRAVEDRLAEDPWTGSHLITDAIDEWTIRLDGRTGS